MPDFDPFNDRTARDIRNALSEAMVDNLVSLDLAPVRKCADQFLGQTNLSPAHHAYIADRLARYQDVYALLQQRREKEPFRQALVLWDARLYFEVHEVMESLWKESSGELKQAYQAMFRAAGTYVHLEQGNLTAARSMADKAVLGLEAHGTTLSAAMALAPLIEALKRLDSRPPSLAAKEEKRSQRQQ